MNTNFKPLGLAAAVAAASVGYSGAASSAASGAINSLGDLVIVPYYTVREGFGTGIHLTNTSDRTQVVKVRLRRGADSMDALDFNIIMSPKDVWTGFLSQEGSDIVLTSQDTSCTAPAMTNGRFVMPFIYRDNAEEGYIEMIGMGSPVDELQAVAVGAEHTTEGVPFDCAAVRSNFFSQTAGLATNPTGVIDSVTTTGYTPNAANDNTGAIVTSMYEDSGDVLKISYFIRDADRGLEFGNDGVHVAGFLDDASITNQQFGIASDDAQGFDYPDLDGGSPTVAMTGLGALRGKYDDLRAVLGGVSVINDWSANGDLNVGTDWVITVPGQYTMLDIQAYFAALIAMAADGNAFTYANTDAAPDSGADNDITDYCLPSTVCDNRDIPLTATFDVYDREEQTLIQPGGDLVVSPQLPGEVIRTLLPAEVNVVSWGVEPVLDSADAITVTTPDSPYGWAELSVIGDPTKGAKLVCDPITPGSCTPVADETLIPMVGFVAWERSFPANPDANYGRIVEHSYGVSSS